MAKSDMSEKISRLRKEQGLTLEQIADKVGVGKSTVRKWETGMIENMRRDKIASLAAALHTTPGYLMGWEDPALPDVPEIQPLPKMKKWKVLGGVACGEPRYLPLEESIEAPADIHADFLFRCSGDSMINARIYDGDYVFVRRGDVPNGCIGVVRVEDSYSLKRIFHGPDYLELRPENPNYETIILRGEQLNAEILGQAVKFISTVR